MARQPKRDPWQRPIEKFLKRYAVDRIATLELLEEAIGLSAAEHTTSAGRRLSLVMAAIGGWQASTNIRFEGATMRGYIRIVPTEIDLRSRNVGPDGEWRPARKR